MDGSKNLKPWAKGQSGNPGGNPRLPIEVRQARKRNQGALVNLVMECFARTDEQVTTKRDDPGTTQLERAVMSLICESYTNANAFKYLTELICGKIPDQDPESPAEQMTPEEKLEVMKRAVEMLEKQVKK